jgi:hypothetical protein
MKLSLCGHLGRRREAAESLRRLREVHSDPTVAGQTGDMPKGLALEVAEIVIEGLRKAGLPDK